MASSTLYPPIINSTLPAFLVGSSSIRIPFQLSRFSQSVSDIYSIHISIVNQTTGKSVVRRESEPERGRYRTTGIVITFGGLQKLEGTDYYYVDILKDDIDGGWTEGWIYKIQIRLSSLKDEPSDKKEQDYLNTNASYFSEWTTFCTTKAISKPTLSIPMLRGFNENAQDIKYNLNLSTIDFQASYSNTQLTNEDLYSYILKLYDSDDNLLENSGRLFANQYQSINSIKYVFKTEVEDTKQYKIYLEYTTVNRYVAEYYFPIQINQHHGGDFDISIASLDNNPELLKSYTTLYQEEEDGRIALKLFSENTNTRSMNICIRRTDSKSNFKVWRDYKIIVLNDDKVEDIPIIYDNTIESGVFYKYGVQEISTTGTRSKLEYFDKPVVRDFEYSYLIGADGRQLALKYDNTMNSYQYTILENKQDTIGGQFPFITRNGNVKYKTFPVNGLISFQMDENHLFMSDHPKEFTNHQHLFADDPDELHLSHVQEKDRIDEVYDFKREFDFREAVLDFLQDGEPKLYKSATEGNTIVRLMQVAAQPNQSLNRMISSVTSTAYEIAEDTIDNYISYGFWSIGDYATRFEKRRYKLGQLKLNLSFGENIIESILDKYNKIHYNIEEGKNKKISVESINGLTIEIQDKLSQVKTSAGDNVLGFNLVYNGNKITIGEYYKFDDNIILTNTDILKVEAPEDKKTGTYDILVNFVYEELIEDYKEKEAVTEETITGIGQFRKCCTEDINIFREIYARYYYESDTVGQDLKELTWTCIEANPDTVFLITDGADGKTEEEHKIGWTGTLNFDIENGYFKGLKFKYQDKPTDIIIDYQYKLEKRTY